MARNNVWKEGPAVRGILRFIATLLCLASIGIGFYLAHIDSAKDDTYVTSGLFIVGGVLVYYLVVLVPLRYRRQRKQLQANPVKCWATIVDHA